MPVIFLETLASEIESSREAEEKEGEMRKANTPPAQDSWEWAQAAQPFSLPALETHSIGMGWSGLRTRTSTALGPLV